MSRRVPVGGSPSSGSQSYGSPSCTRLFGFSSGYGFGCGSPSCTRLFGSGWQKSCRVKLGDPFGGSA